VILLNILSKKESVITTICCRVMKQLTEFFWYFPTKAEQDSGYMEILNTISEYCDRNFNTSWTLDRDVSPVEGVDGHRNLTLILRIRNPMTTEEVDMAHTYFARWFKDSYDGWGQTCPTLF
jgi:hypothetical protein